MKSWIVLVFCLLLTAACAVKPDDPGLCKLNCSNAVIAGNDTKMSIKAKTTALDTVCSASAAGQPLTDAYFVQFLIGEEFDDGTAVPGTRPVPNISIEPISDGLRSSLAAHNPNVEISGTYYNPERYKAIITPKDNWCSDSCGVVSLEVFGQCPGSTEDASLGLQIHTGALFSDKMIFEISTK